MITYPGNLRIVERVEDLPDLHPTDLYMDAETTSGQDRVEAFRPYAGHRACGWAVTCDDVEGAWYVPIRHRGPGAVNLPIEPVLEWMRVIQGRAKRWINHNVKFDRHFAHVDGVEFEGDLVCTLALSKTIDSDRWSHSLKVLMRDWLDMTTEEQDEVAAYLDGIKLPHGAKCKDWARVPIDVLGRYACMDVIGNRKLWAYIQGKRPEGMEKLWETEIALTSVLFRMERRGMRVDVDKAKSELLKTCQALVMLGDEFTRITSRELSDSNNLFHEILCVQYGLPVLKWNKDKKTGKRTGPSFDKEALALYGGHPRVVTDPDGLGRVMKVILAFRKWDTYRSLFLESFLEHNVDGVLHSSYNQTVRTGRMSCSLPNSQQFDQRAGRLIVPREGKKFICFDASQVEFRLIVHYVKDADAIAAYALDADTDFHQWVADLCGVSRKAAKTLNFAMAYGAGKPNVTRQLMNNPDVMKEVREQVEHAIEHEGYDESMRATLYEGMCKQRAQEIYLTYHTRLPGIRAFTEKAGELCRLRGWVKNAYGRRRHLPAKASHRAFNSIVQGCAMDAIKERMVFIEDMAPMIANKHDELLSEVDLDFDGMGEITEALCNVQVDFRVPIRWQAGESDENWTEAKP